jgi:carbamoyl-phosphate synthase large subunit
MKVLILGSGPNRIGQGIEFDYACVQAIFALREEGVQTVMINCNPETVSTDYDTADRLYFEPIVLENVLEIIRREKPDGLLIQFGGQTPLKLSHPPEEPKSSHFGHRPREHRHSRGQGKVQGSYKPTWIKTAREPYCKN